MMIRKTLLAAALLGLPGIAAAQAEGSAPTHQPRPDPLGDATVSRADAQAKAESEFAKLDADHDGFLSADEFSGMFPPDSRMRMMAPMMMTRVDTNGDGKISKDEFVGSALKRFDAMDANHDGQLTKAERDAAREAMRARMRQGGGGGGGGGWGGHGGGGFGGGPGGDSPPPGGGDGPPPGGGAGGPPGDDGQ